MAFLKAIRHPLRVRMLARLNEKVASPAMLARELGISIPLASYHVDVLRETGCIELVKTTPSRGATEHHYRALRRAMIDEAEWASLTPAQRAPITQQLLEDVAGHAFAALHDGALDRRDNQHLSWTDLYLDEQAFGELSALMEEVVQRGFELQAESAGRAHEGAGEPDMVRSRLALLCYEGSPVTTRPPVELESR